MARARPHARPRPGPPPPARARFGLSRRRPRHPSRTCPSLIRGSPKRPRGVAPAEPTPPPAQAQGSDAAPPLASDRLEQEGVASPIDLDAPAPAAPDHVSADPVLVREEAEAGAQDGAGASITVQEPWDGYGQLNARDIVGRLGAASTAELAAVQLYEGAHRNRQTVIAAVQRELAKSQR